MAFLVGILDGSKDTWGVRVPNVRGCHGGGATPEQAIRDAISALCELGEEIRDIKPRDAATIANDPAAAYDPSKGESFVMLPVLAASGIPSKANVSIDKRQLDVIDAAAKTRGLTRSAFFVEAALDKIRPSAAEGMKVMSKAAAKIGPHPDFPMPHPGTSIVESIAAMAEPKTAIARRLGISRRALYDLLDGKSAITAPMALRLESVIGGSAEFWLRRQVQYDLWKARKEFQTE